jgi:predicted nucleotidyltransferase component of viral defense system
LSPRDIAASVRQRLLNLARERGEDFGLVLTRYALERVMYRLSVSEHHDQFVLKGAMLFALWADDPHRSTRDLDLLGHGTIDTQRLEEVFREVIGVEVENDGLEFLAETVRGERIREDEEYEGVRVHLETRLAAARIKVQIDVGFGDAVTPAPEETEYPVLLDFPAPRLRAYPRETVVAEKFEAMVKLGIANSRMKDFYDLWVMARDFEFDGALLSRAIKATFERRGTALPTDVPLALSDEFSEDQAKKTQWSAFLRRLGRDVAGTSLAEVTKFLSEFLMPPVSAATRAETFDKSWHPAGPWR